MKREDIDKIIDEYLSEYHSSLVKDYIQELEDKIDKAIEYIEKQDKWFKNEEYKLIKEKELLNILQGSDKE